MAAYADHASVLGKESEEVFAFIHEVLEALALKNLSVEELLQLALRVGGMNFKVMELLEDAEVSLYGNPTPTQVR